MSENEITFEQICNSSRLNDCGTCEDENVKITLDRLEKRVVFKPEDMDNQPRADCAIFFTPSNRSSGRGIPLSAEDDSEESPEYISIVELKSNYEDAKKVKEQISGGIEFVIELLRECGDPPWNLEWYCLVPHDTGYKRRVQKTIHKSIRGNHCIFHIDAVDNGESLCDIINRDMHSVEM